MADYQPKLIPEVALAGYLGLPGDASIAGYVQPQAPYMRDAIEQAKQKIQEQK